MLDRRRIFKLGLLGGASALLAAPVERLSEKAARADEIPPTPFRVTPFRVAMPVPPVLQPVAPFKPGQVYHGIAPEFSRYHPDHAADWSSAAPEFYEIFSEQRIAQIIPGMDTPVFTYRDATRPAGTGTVPGPTILARFNEPAVLRHHNRLLARHTYVHHDIETSVHLHGAHAPAHADGHPAFYVLPGQARDYYCPYIVPKRLIAGQPRFDLGTVPSTMWYHDHAMDITGFNVSRGLVGFCLLVDDLEADLMDGKYPVLPDVSRLDTDPANSFDIPIALTDQRFNADGTLFYDFLDHDGRLGDVFTVNGVAQPYFRVQRRKYRFRILNASSARVYELRLSSGQSFLQIGNDSWLLPKAISVARIQLAQAQRADVIVDFRDAPAEVFLENIMQQTDGRKPDGPDPNRPTPLIKFIVQGPRVGNDVTVAAGTVLRPHDPIRPQDVVATREFEFERGNGAWQVNGRLFNPRRADAVPVRDPDGIKAERWILRNRSGGWAHPIHMHLEHHEVQKINGKAPPPARRFKSDTTYLGPNTTAEVLIRFRTFSGPFVFHCHNLEHEDMRMMATFDPRPAGESSPLDGVREIERTVSGVPKTCEQLESTLYFDADGDVDRVEGEGVGFPCDDFEFNRLR